MPPEENRPRVSPARIGIWIVVGGIGVYMVVSGLIAALTSGG
ncbi:hypothetical protein [Microbacterium sp. 4R-513]|nr:hypothetical protein [Microbacterium sp. 4R-513]